jgi:ZIP family zinc transporter
MAALSSEALGFILVCAAGSSTAIGAGIVYNSNLVVLASKKVLGGSLGLSAGVMLYVSFVEIFAKSVLAFTEEAGHDEAFAYLYSTLCFFAGIVIIRAIDSLVHWLAPTDVQLCAVDLERVSAQLDDGSLRRLLSYDKGKDELEGLTPTEVEEGKVADKVELKDRSESDKEDVAGDGGDVTVSAIANSNRGKGVTATGEVELRSRERPLKSADKDIVARAAKDSHLYGSKEEDTSLERMGLFTALAIAIHNFPEGLATFVATQDDPAVGVGLAVAIAIHNIPEGLCVAMPIYFATGNRHKAFAWGVLSGMSEILAGGLGWIILANVFDGNVYGILFGLVAGMMVSICLYELLPTARKYDTHDDFVTHSVVFGMVLMSISLVVFMF